MKRCIHEYRTDSKKYCLLKVDLDNKEPYYKECSPCADYHPYLIDISDLSFLSWFFWIFCVIAVFIGIVIVFIGVFGL